MIPVSVSMGSGTSITNDPVTVQLPMRRVSDADAFRLLLTSCRTCVDAVDADYSQVLSGVVSDLARRRHYLHSTLASPETLREIYRRDGRQLNSRVIPVGIPFGLILSLPSPAEMGTLFIVGSDLSRGAPILSGHAVAAVISHEARLLYRRLRREWGDHAENRPRTCYSRLLDHVPRRVV